MLHPIALTAAAIIISSAALVFFGAITKKRFKGTYSVSAKDIPQAKGECTLSVLRVGLYAR